MTNASSWIDLGRHLSVNYGVNNRSVLSKVHYFKVSKCLPFDTMHVLLEGVIPMEIRFSSRRISSIFHVM